MEVPAQGAQTNSPFLCLFVLFGSLEDWWCPHTVVRMDLLYLVYWLNANLFWEHPHRHTQKSCLPALWASFRPNWHTKLTNTGSCHEFLRKEVTWTDLWFLKVTFWNRWEERLKEQDQFVEPFGVVKRELPEWRPWEAWTKQWRRTQRISQPSEWGTNTFHKYYYSLLTNLHVPPPIHSPHPSQSNCFTK